MFRVTMLPMGTWMELAVSGVLCRASCLGWYIGKGSMAKGRKQTRGRRCR